MKTAMKICFIIGASLILLGSVIFICAMSGFKWDFKNLTTSKLKTSSYEITEDFDGIYIKTDEADISFAVSDNDSYKVICYESENTAHNVKVVNGKLKVEIVNNRKWYEYIGIFGGGNPMITVYLPRGEYGSLTVESSTGDIGVPKDFSFESADISLSTGDVLFEASSVGELKIVTTTGDIDLRSSRVAGADLSVSTGHVRVADTQLDGELKIGVSTGKAKVVDVNCKSFASSGTTGDLYLKNLLVEEKLTAKRSTGDVEFYSCDASELFIECGTGDVEGTLRSEKVFVTKTGTGDVEVPRSTSGGVCEVITSTGDIEISIGRD